MPYESMEDVNPAIKGIEPPVTLAQANIIAGWADRIEEEGDVESSYAVAIAQFKETYKIADGSWVKRTMASIRELWEAVKRLFEPLLQERERALSLASLYDQVVVALDGMPDWPWLHGLYREDNGSFFVIVSIRGKLFRAPMIIEGNTVTLGEQTEVTEEFAPTGETRGRTSIVRQADGRVRWLSISATSVLNRVGEIDSRALFDSFVTHATETGEYPYRCFYHQGEALRTGQADFLARDGDVFVTSGLYDETPLALAEIAALERDVGAWEESIHYDPTDWPDLEEMAPDVVVPVFNRGRMIEISTVPRDRAAAWFTAINVVREANMRDEVYTALVTLLDGDEEQAKGFAALVDGTNRQVQEEGLVARAAGETETEETITVDGQAEVTWTNLEGEKPVEREFVLDEAALDAIAGRFDELLAPLAARLDTLEVMAGEEGASQVTSRSQAAALDEAARGLLELDERLVALERTDEQKQERWLADLPRSTRTRVTYRPRTATPEEREAAGPQNMADIAAATLSNAPRVQ